MQILKLLLLETPMTSSSSGYGLVPVFMSSPLCCIEPFLFLLSLSSPGPLDITVSRSSSSWISSLVPGLPHLFPFFLCQPLIFSSLFPRPSLWLSSPEISTQRYLQPKLPLEPIISHLVISSAHLPSTQSQQVLNGAHPLFPDLPLLPYFPCFVCCT